jgi:hypothetical protein
VQAGDGIGRADGDLQLFAETCENEPFINHQKDSKKKDNAGSERSRRPDYHDAQVLCLAVTLGPLNIRTLDIFLGYASPCFMDYPEKLMQTFEYLGVLRYCRFCWSRVHTKGVLQQKIRFDH